MLAWGQLFQLFLTFPYLLLTFEQLLGWEEPGLRRQKVDKKLTKVEEKLRKVEKVNPRQVFVVAHQVQGPPNACLELTFSTFVNLSLTFVNFLATFWLGRTRSAGPES